MAIFLLYVPMYTHTHTHTYTHIKCLKLELVMKLIADDKE